MRNQKTIPGAEDSAILYYAQVIERTHVRKLSTTPLESAHMEQQGPSAAAAAGKGQPAILRDGAAAAGAAVPGARDAQPAARGASVPVQQHSFIPPQFDEEVQSFVGEWDNEGVWLYQAFNDAIADFALKHQRLGGPAFNPKRMTWVKPSFAWVLYRSGYGHKHNQQRVLKLKVPHEALAALLSRCKCKHGGGGSKGRVQWDPARDLMSADGREPRRMLQHRAIQIGLKADLSEMYVNSVVAIEDVTALAHAVGEAHSAGTKEAMAALVPKLPIERPYLPACSKEVLSSLAMLPGVTAKWVAHIGLGKAFPK